MSTQPFGDNASFGRSPPSNFVGTPPPPPQPSSLNLNGSGEALHQSISVPPQPSVQQVKSEDSVANLLTTTANPVRAQHRIMESMRGGMNLGTPGSAKRAIDQNAFGVADEEMDSKDPEFSLPWDFRSAQDRTTHISTCDFMTTTHFWQRVEWAAQFAFVSCLPAAILGNHQDTKTFFKAGFVLLSFCVSCTNRTLGRAIFGLFDVIKAILLTWVLLTIIFAIDISFHWALWGAVYCIGNFCIAYVCDSIVAKNAAFLFTIGMVIHYTTRDLGAKREGLMYPTYLVRDVCIGAGLGFVSAVLPRPRSDYTNAEANFNRLVIATSVCTMGLSESLFTDNNMHRTANLVKVRSARTRMAEELAQLKENVEFARYEPVSGLRIAELAARAKLLEEVADTLDSLIAVVGFVQSNPQKFHVSKLADQFRHHFGNGFKFAGEHVDKFLHILTWRRKNASDERVLQHVEDKVNSDFGEAMDKVMKALGTTLEEILTPGDTQPMSTSVSPAQRSHHERGVSMEDTAGNIYTARPPPSSRTYRPGSTFQVGLEEWRTFPRMEIGFFTFNMMKIVTLLKTFEEPEVWGTWRAVVYNAFAPMRTMEAAWTQIKELFLWTPAARAQALAAAKLSFCMTSAVAVILSIKVGDAIFGPAVIAFVAGGDSAQTVQTALTQLIGTVFGNVFGYLLASISSDIVAQVAFIVIVAFISGFFRSSSTYGLAAFYAQFAAFGSIRPDLDAKGALISIQQNTACICWYVIVAAALFPSRPSVALFDEMKRGFDKVKTGIASMEHMLSRNDLDSIDAALEQNAKQKASIRMQELQLAGAAVEPSLVSHPFPTHLVDKTIEMQTRIVSLLSPLSLAWGLLMTSPERLTTDTCVIALLPHLKTLVVQVEKLMGLLILVLDRDVATLTPLLVKASMKLQQISVDLEASESNESFRLALELSEANNSSGAYIDSANLGSPPLLTVIYCCISLTHELFQLYLSVSEMRHALQAS